MMNRIGLYLLSIASLFFSGCVTSSSSHSRNAEGGSLIGSYQFSSGSEPDDVYISITVSQSGRKTHLDFQADHPDGHGAAPDGNGTGEIGPDGVFRFTYEDSFSNRGTGTFQHSPRGYELSIKISDVSDPRCMMFYGDFMVQPARPTANNL